MMNTKQPLGPKQQAWIDALKSGEYKQGERAALFDGEGYCCLGVACALLGQLPPYKASTMPPETRNTYGFYNGIGEGVRSEITPLYILNDGSGFSDRHSFSEIAAIVEQDPSLYFKGPA
jgi:hypothetical protein